MIFRLWIISRNSRLARIWTALGQWCLNLNFLDDATGTTGYQVLLVTVSANRLTIFQVLLGTGQQVSTISDTWRARISACAARFLSKHETHFVPAMPPPLLSPGYLGLWSAASLKGQNDVKAAAKLSGARSNFVH